MKNDTLEQASAALQNSWRHFPSGEILEIAGCFLPLHYTKGRVHLQSLYAVLSTLAVNEDVIPLPILRAEALLSEAFRVEHTSDLSKEGRKPIVRWQRHIYARPNE